MMVLHCSTQFSFNRSGSFSCNQHNITLAHTKRCILELSVYLFEGDFLSAFWNFKKNEQSIVAYYKPSVMAQSAQIE